MMSPESRLANDVIDRFIGDGLSGVFSTNTRKSLFIGCNAAKDHGRFPDVCSARHNRDRVRRFRRGLVPQV